MPTTYTTAEAAALLGVTPGRLRQIATEGRAGERTIQGWRFRDSDLAALRTRQPGRPRVDLEPRDVLTLSPQEATLVVAALNGHVRTPGVAAQQELLLSVFDSCGPDCEGERLDEVHGVADWRGLIARIAALSDAQADMVLEAAAAFWELGGHADHIADDLHTVGLV